MAALSLVVGLTVSLFVFAFGAAAIFAAVYCYYRKAHSPLSVPWKRNADLESGGGVAVAAGPSPCPSAKVWHDDPDGSGIVGVRQYGWSEIRRLTGNFTSTVVGQGGFSTVYLAHLPGAASLVAVKVHRERTDRLCLAFRQELDVLQRVGRHDHIVRLLGYCDVDGEDGTGDEDEDGEAIKAAGALVLEYVPNGTLHEALHGNGAGIPNLEEEVVMEWGRRMSVAYQLASALEYLHEGCDPQVVHCDVKPSNVLLDGDASCKLCDFGSAKTGFSSTICPPSSTGQQHHHQIVVPPSQFSSAAAAVYLSPNRNASGDHDATDYNYNRRRQARPVLGSPGYVDPHYLRTGVASKKSDVYSFGVVVLELLTGTEAFCPKTERMLTAVVRPVLKQLAEPEPAVGARGNYELLRELVDTRLDAGQYVPAEAMAMAGLALGCLKEQPSMRPSMSDVMETMRDKVPSAFSADQKYFSHGKFSFKQDGAGPYK